MTEQQLLFSISNVAQVFADLSVFMRQITNDLIEAISIWDEDRVNNLIQTRTEMCCRMETQARELEPLIEEARALAATSNTQHTQALLSIVDYIIAQHDSLMKQQKECESIMSQQLAVCRTELMGFKQRKGLQNAYCRTSAESARFLDRAI